MVLETLYAMKERRKGHRGDLALKIDISKAYDRVDWNYLDSVMRQIGFQNDIKWM